MSAPLFVLTGGCGFLGQHLTGALLEAFPEARVRLLDVCPNPHALLDFAGHPRVAVETGVDVTDAEALRGRLDGASAVVHLAGVVAFGLKDRARLGAVNVGGTRAVLAEARRAGVGHVVHVSSVAALGYTDDPARPADEAFRFDWREAERHRKFYMLSKRDADAEVARYRARGATATVVYPGLLFGPGDVTNSAPLIRAVASGALRANPPGGTNVVDVRDAARGVACVLAREVGNEDLLLSGHNLTFAEISATVADVLAVAPPRRLLPRGLDRLLSRPLLVAEKMLPRPPRLTADQVHSAFRFRYFSNQKAQARLGWAPAFSFRRTAHDAVGWMRATGRLT